MKSYAKTITVFMFIFMLSSSIFIGDVQAGKKKLLAALLIGAALAAKPKILPIPLPIPIPIKKEEKKYVPVPQPYPIYIDNGYGGGGHYGGYGDDGYYGGGGYY